MRDQNLKGKWVDQYLRNKLSNDDEEAFETELLESSELQQELPPDVFAAARERGRAMDPYATLTELRSEMEAMEVRAG